jgi:hypothetical protein
MTFAAAKGLSRLGCSNNMMFSKPAPCTIIRQFRFPGHHPELQPGADVCRHASELRLATVTQR